jgi:hypothetical protein
MKSFWIIAITVVVLTLLPLACRSQIYYPLGGDVFDFAYEQIARIGIRDQDHRLVAPIGPYPTEIMREASRERSMPSLRMFDPQSGPRPKLDNPSLAGDSVNLFSLAAERYHVIRGQRGDDLPFAAAGFTYRPDRRVGAVMFFDIDRAKTLDPTYAGKIYRGMAGGVETAVITFRTDRVSLALGRQRIFWGPKRINLLISETAEPLDMLSASYRAGRLTFSFLFARLDGSRPDYSDSLRFPDRTFNDNRYLVGHRLDLTLHRTLRVGLFETVLFGGEGRPPELYYLNPLQFFHAAQLNENENDNTILGMDFTCLPAGGMGIYGQFIVDDVQIDNQEPGDKEPAEWGMMAGVITAGRPGTAVPDIRLEYTRLTNRTYHQRDPCNRYLYRNQLIGHPLGPDADSLSLAIRFWPTDYFYSEVEGAYRRKGEGSIRSSWDEPWLLAAGEYSEPFPTGVVEKAMLVSVALRGYLPVADYARDHLFLSVAAGWGEVHNYQHVDGDVATVAWVRAGIAWLGAVDFALD